MSATFIGKISEYFEDVTDPRLNRGTNYPLIEMVFVALCGAICDCNSWVDVATFGKCKLTWFRKFLPFDKGVPSHDTFTELFARLETLEFYAALESWTRHIAQSLQGETVAFDGKTLRGSFDKASHKSALHSVSAWACGLKLCIALKSVEDKSNEIPAVQQLAPEIQERLLFLPRVARGKEEVCLKDLQEVARVVDWSKQLERSNELFA